MSFNDFFFSRALLKVLAVGMQIASVSIDHTTGKVNEQNKTTQNSQRRSIWHTKFVDKALFCETLCEREYG